MVEVQTLKLFQLLDSFLMSSFFWLFSPSATLKYSKCSTESDVKVKVSLFHNRSNLLNGCKMLWFWVFILLTKNGPCDLSQSDARGTKITYSSLQRNLWMARVVLQCLQFYRVWEDPRGSTQPLTASSPKSSQTHTEQRLLRRFYIWTENDSTCC